MTGRLTVLTLGLIAGCILAASAQAEMIVTTHDGRELRLPVNASDISKIEYTQQGTADKFVSTASRGGRNVQYIGCFKDSNARDLKGYSFSNTAMTTSLCVSACKERGFTYAATQFATQCFCDNSYGKFGAANNCDAPCGGNSNEMCGGTWANSVYRIR